MVIALSLTAAVIPQPTKLELFKDWLVGCDNGRACHATSLGPDAAEQRFDVSIKRGPEPDAEVEIEIWSVDPQVKALAVDGKPLRLTLTPSREVWPIEGEARTYFLDAVKPGRQLQFLKADGSIHAVTSLEGLNAALLYMDDRQKRVETMSALIRKGSEPSFKVPKAPILPVVEVPPPSKEPPLTIGEAMVKQLQKDNCDFELEAEEPGAETARLDAHHTLAMIPLRCWSGAYNHASLLLVNWGEGKWKPVRFDTDSFDETDNPPGIAFNAMWEPEKNLLTTYMKGRGIGDCGVIHNYAWDGTRFRLVERADMSECRGSVDYITTWRAEIRTARQ
ncbi:MAG TPA: DUF1176 domain-containing protein [Allosphingosinicella sp.]|uniref:DUF1176 domain-containing protein n=1 Tax=Allosphingosinicella sp. TaxID=2823234 RepID=UPI002ED81B40